MQQKLIIINKIVNPTVVDLLMSLNSFYVKKKLVVHSDDLGRNDINSDCLRQPKRPYFIC